MQTQQTHASRALRPTTQMIIDAAEALLLQSGARYVTISDEDLCEQIVADRGVRFDLGVLSEVAHSILDTEPRDIEQYRVTERWLRSFKSFLSTTI